MSTEVEYVTIDCFLFIMENMDLPGYFHLISVKCCKIRTFDYKQNTVDGLQSSNSTTQLAFLCVGQS